MAKKQSKPKPAQSPEQALYQALSLCVKAGRLVMGFDAVAESALKGEACLVLTAADASVPTQERMQRAVGGVVDVCAMPLTKADLALFSRRPVVVYAVTDANLARLCREKLKACGASKHEEEMSE